MVPVTTPEGIDALLTSAAAARVALRRTTPDERAGWLSAVAVALEAQRDDLVDLADREKRLLH